VVNVRPATIVRWHRLGWRIFWRRKCRRAKSDHSSDPLHRYGIPWLAGATRLAEQSVKGRGDGSLVLQNVGIDHRRL
jgi:hypothetical protein